MQRQKARLVSALIVMAAAVAGGCGDHTGSSRLSSTELVGVYDVTADEVFANDTNHVELLGFVGAGDDGRISIDIVRGALAESFVIGRLEDDGSVMLDGKDMTADVQSFVKGVAQVRLEAGVYRITADLESGAYGRTGRARFTMERPVDVSAADASGRYRFEFPSSASGCDCASSSVVDIAFNAIGGAKTAPAVETDATGVTVARIDAGSAFLSPRGRFLLQARYHSAIVPSTGPVFEDDMGLVGELHPMDGEPAGSGRFESQFTFTFIGPRTGAWTARRISP